MKQKEITICGKQVTLAYCYATEISYKIQTGEEITAFITEAIGNIQQKKMPDTKKSIHLIIAAMQAYYESKKEKMPITDNELMFEVNPTELGTAIGTIIGLRSEFYYIPSDEPKDNNTDNNPKND